MTQWEFSSTGDEVVEAYRDMLKDKTGWFNVSRLFPFLTSTVIITGPGKGGIGAETAISIASALPAIIIVVGRTESKITPVTNEITAKYPDVKAKFVSVDLGSQKSVRKAAAEINNSVEKIDLLINNAAIMACPYAETEDGIESQFATNHIGH